MSQRINRVLIVTLVNSEMQRTINIFQEDSFNSVALSRFHLYAGWHQKKHETNEMYYLNIEIYAKIEICIIYAELKIYTFNFMQKHILKYM